MQNRIKTLLIDDSNTYHELYKAALHDEIFELRFAHDGAAGLDLYKAWEPDIILLDMEMPKMDGQTVLKEIREGHDDTSTAVIMQTSHSDKDAVMACAALGISGYIVKPPDVASVSEQILTYYEKKAPDVVWEAKRFFSKHKNSFLSECLNQKEVEYMEEFEFLLKNGEISDSHKRLLDRRAKQLELSVTRARELEQMLIDPESVYTPEEQEYMEEIEFCLETGPIDDTERLHLTRRREKLNIPEERAAALETKICEERENDIDKVLPGQENDTPSQEQG